MISPELLRRYPFFGALAESQLKQIAMITEEGTYKKGITLFEECQPADTLYLLLEGSIDLTYKLEDASHPGSQKQLPVGEINPGEVFGISALIEPYTLNASATTAQDCRLVKIDAEALRTLFAEDHQMAYHLMTQAAKTAMERLASSRVQLAAAWAK